jgi:hypothetical protein
VQVLLASAELPNSLGALPMPVPEAASSRDCEVQVLRSAGPWALGVSTEQSIYQAWCDAIGAAEHCIYVEQQFFITSMEPEPAEEGAHEASASRDAQPTPSAAAAAAAAASAPAAATAVAKERFVAVVPAGLRPGAVFHVKTVHPTTGGETVSAVTVPPGGQPGDQLVIEVSSQSSLPPPLPYPGASVSSSALAPVGPSGGSGSSGFGAHMAELATSVASAVAGAVATVHESIQDRVDGAVLNRIGHALWQRLRRAILAAQRRTAAGQPPFRVLVVLPLHPNGKFLESTDCQV